MLKEKLKQNTNSITVNTINYQNSRGITMVALVITIIIMLILIGVTVNLAIDGGLVDKAKYAAKEQEKAQVKELLLGYSIDYYEKKDVTLSEDTIDKMAEISIKTGISTDKLAVHYNPSDESQPVLYRIDKTSQDEWDMLEAEGIKPLYGDADLDGFLTKNDAQLIKDYSGSQIDDFTDDQKKISDINGDGDVNILDSTVVGVILGGGLTYNGEHETTE